MELKCPATIRLLRKVLEHFRIADRHMPDIRLQKFAELVVDNVQSRITFGTQTFRDALIKFNCLKPQKRVEDTAGSQRGINSLECCISLRVEIFQFTNEVFDRLAE